MAESTDLELENGYKSRRDFVKLGLKTGFAMAAVTALYAPEARAQGTGSGAGSLWEGEEGEEGQEAAALLEQTPEGFGEHTLRSAGASGNGYLDAANNASQGD